MKSKRASLNIELYKKIYLIRRAERAIVENYSSDDMKTPMHMSMGEEAIVAGIVNAFSMDDLAFGTYRSHALYLSMTGETDKFFAEMYGKRTGAVKGKGGSMHLLSPKNGLMVTSAVVASTIPLACGAAYAKKYQKQGGIITAFFGDGAIDEGEFWESLNIACLMKLPVFFVCQDNNFAVHTAAKLRHGYKSIFEIVSKFDCDAFEIESTDVEIVFNKAKEIISSIRKKQRPAFLYTKYYRYLEHVGIHEDFDKGYRHKKEYMVWKKTDPCDMQRKKLLSLGILEKGILQIESEIEKKVAKSLFFAQTSKFPEAGELEKDVFYAQD